MGGGIWEGIESWSWWSWCHNIIPRISKEQLVDMYMNETQDLQLQRVVGGNPGGPG